VAGDAATDRPALFHIGGRGDERPDAAQRRLHRFDGYG
jgi:hypothetical protein